MAEQRSYRRIIVAGIVTLAALAVFGIVARRTFLSFEFDLVTYLDDSAGISPSSPVLLHGIQIGHVRRVALSGSKQPDRVVRVDMRFNRSYLPQIPEDSTIAIVASNLLGDKSLDIARGIHPKSIAPGSEIRSTATQDIGSVLNRGAEPLKKVDTILARVDRILREVDQNEGTAGLLINDTTLQKRLQAITAGFEDIQKRYKNGTGVVFRIADIQTEANRPVARLNTLMADLNHGKGTLGLYLHDPNDPALAKEASDITSEARKLMDDAAKDPRPKELMKQFQVVSDKTGTLIKKIDAGEGTVGQFVVNPELLNTVHQISTELNSFMADFSKHPSAFVKLRFGLF